MKKINEICYFVETLVDEYTLTRKKPRASFLKYLQSENVDRKTINNFLLEGISNLQLQLLEVEGALSGEDPVLKEAYSSFRKPELREFKQMLSDIIDDAVIYKETKKVVRKIKPHSPEKLVHGLNILESSVMIEGKKYVSHPKVDIVGSKYLVFYNTKVNEVTVFIGKNLSCKGSRIINYNETIGGTKKLKKPIESLDLLIQSNQYNLENNFVLLPNKLKTFPKIISSNFILLKVIK